MNNIRVIAPGPLTTIQDAGRYAYQQSGMSASGVMDSYAHRTANILVGNPQHEAVLEATLLGPTLSFSGDCVIAITGGKCQPQLNGVPAAMWKALRIKQGDTLSFQVVHSGLRLYIAFAGGIDVPEIMGSKSTCIKAGVGGLNGRALQKDDVLSLLAGSAGIAALELKAAHRDFIPAYSSALTLRVVMGPQDKHFTRKGIKIFKNSTYVITQNSDRMGYRLEGEPIAFKSSSDIISDGIVMGGIQVPGNGKPIVLMSDRQTTGGYAKIAGVIAADLPLMGQARPGNTIRFVPVRIEEAHEILAHFEEKFHRFQESLELVQPT